MFDSKYPYKYFDACIGNNIALPYICGTFGRLAQLVRALR